MLTPVFAYTVEAATAATAVSFNVIGGYDKYLLVYDTMTSGTQLGLSVADKADGKYQTLYLTPNLASAPVAFNIPSAMVAAAIELPFVGQFFRVDIVSASTASAKTFTVICKQS